MNNVTILFNESQTIDLACYMYSISKAVCSLIPMGKLGIVVTCQVNTGACPTKNEHLPDVLSDQCNHLIVDC